MCDVKVIGPVSCRLVYSLLEQSEFTLECIVITNGPDSDEAQREVFVLEMSYKDFDALMQALPPEGKA